MAALSAGLLAGANGAGLRLALSGYFAIPAELQRQWQAARVSVPQMRLPAALKWLRRRQEAERVQLYKHTAHPLQQSRCSIIANPSWFEKQTFFLFNCFTFL